MRPEPESHIVPPAPGFRVVLESRAVVQDPAIVDKQHLAGLKHELGGQIALAEHAIENIQGVNLVRREWTAGLLMTAVDPVAQVTVAQLTSIPVENGLLDRR